MTTYSILVTQAPSDSQLPYSAIQFCHALVKAGHAIDNIFFYGPGVYNANRLQSPSQDEINIYQQWCDIAHLSGAHLLVCVTAALKRGIVDSAEASQLGLDAHTITTPFKQSGLGDFFTALHHCDGLIQF